MGVFAFNNSTKTCLQAPHGGVIRFAFVTIHKASISFFLTPLLYAAKTAFRSAHIVEPYAAFSILAPRKKRPSFVFKQAPT